MIGGAEKIWPISMPGRETKKAIEDKTLNRLSKYQNVKPDPVLPEAVFPGRRFYQWYTDLVRVETKDTFL